MARARGRGRAVPPGYPASYESTVRLQDGRRVQIRPILPSDAPELADAIRTADAETLHNRFLGGAPRPSEAVLRSLTELDYVTRFAVVARSRGHGIGIARYAALPPADDGTQAADVAVVVAPQWRRVGLATVLVELLGRRALECGIAEFTALFLPTNRPVASLAHEGHARVVIKEGAANLYAPLATAEADPTELRPTLRE